MTAQHKIEFPVIRCFPVKSRSDHKYSMTLKADEWSLHAWGRLPLSKEVIPGGLLDSAGYDIPITDIVDTRKIPKWLRPVDTLVGAFNPFRLYRIDYVFGEPRKLSLAEFKNKLCDLLALERESFEGSGLRCSDCQASVLSVTTYSAALFATGHLPSAPPWKAKKT